MGEHGLGKKILIIEEREAQASALEETLCGNSYDTVIARNGAEGMEMARDMRPALVLSGVVTPVLDGFKVCREIKSDPALQHMPVVLITHLAAPEDIIRGLDNGADGYITEPFRPDFLLSKVNSLLAGPVQVTNNREERRIDLDYGGKHFEIHAGRTQVVSFLLSTYENAALQNMELSRVQEEIKDLNESLENKVRERTAALRAEISDRNAAEEALRENEERFRAVVEAANDAVICLEPPDSIYMWNRKAEETFGYPASEAIGKELHMLIVPEKYRDRTHSGLKLFFETGEGDLVGRTVEVTALRRDGTEFPVEVSISAFKVRGGWNSVGIVRDITERKRLEEEMRQNLDGVERMNRLMVGRELKMEELRDEVRVLRARVKGLESSGPEKP